MDKFLELMKTSVIFSGFIVVAFVSTYCYLLVTSKPIPDELTQLLFVVTAFFFGQRAAKQNGAGK